MAIKAETKKKIHSSSRLNQLTVSFLSLAVDRDQEVTKTLWHKTRLTQTTTHEAQVETLGNWDGRTGGT